MDQPRPPSAGRLAPTDAHALTQSAFYEKGGKLEITDTTLHFGNGAFSMEKARYRVSLATELDQNAPIEYRYETLRLAFAPTGLLWSGTSGEKIAIAAGVDPVRGRLINNAQEVEGEDDPQLAGKGVIYENAYGAGLHLGVLTKNLVFRKIVRFDALDDLGAIPERAEVLEVGFELSTGPRTTFEARFGGDESRLWDQRETVVAREEPVALGTGEHKSFILPANAWDSAGNQIPIDLELKNEGGRLFLTKRIPVDWLRDASFPVYADVDLRFGSALIFHTSLAFLSPPVALDPDHVLIAYRNNGGSGVGTARVLDVTGTTLSFHGGPRVFEAASTSEIGVTLLDSTHVVIAYAASSVGNATVGTVDLLVDPPISFGASRVFSATPVGYVSATTLDSTHVVISYRSSSQGMATVGTVDLLVDPPISFGTPGVFNPANSTFTSVTALDPTHVVISYNDSGNSFFGTAIVGTVDLLVDPPISFGLPRVFNSGDTRPTSATTLDSTHVVIAWNDILTDTLWASVGTINLAADPAIGFGPPVLFNPLQSNSISVTALDSTHAAIVFVETTDVPFAGKALVATISGGDTISLGNATVFNPDVNVPLATMLDATHVVITYRDGLSSDFNAAIVGEIVTSVSELIGFETGSAPDEGVTLGAGSTLATGVDVRAGSGDYALKQASALSTLMSGRFPDIGQLAMRFSFRKLTDPSTNTTLLQFRNGADLWRLELTTTGLLRVVQSAGGTLGLTATSGTNPLPDNTWVTVRILYDRGAGERLKVWIDNSLEIDVPHSTVGAGIDEIQVLGDSNPNEYFYDDFYIGSSESIPPLGQIVHKPVTGAGNNTEFGAETPASSIHWQNVDELSPDTSDYNNHGDSVATDLYALEDSAAAPRTVSGTINAVKGMWSIKRGNGAATDNTQHYAWREGDPGSETTRNAEIPGITTSFVVEQEIWSAPPNSGGSWTTTKLDGLQLGAKHNTTGAQDTFIAWTVAMVDYSPSLTVDIFSIGTSYPSNLHSTGTAAVPMGSTTVTFSAALPLPTDVPAVGPGDVLVIDGEALILRSRDSDFQVTLQSPALADHSTPTAVFSITRAFGQIVDWEAAVQGDLVAQNRIVVGVAYKDGPFDETVIIDGSNTDSSRYLLLTVAPGQRHDGTAGTGVVLDPALDGHAFTVQDDYTRIEWFEVTGWSGGSSEAFRINADFTTYANMLVHGGPETTDADSDAFYLEPANGDWTATVRNSIVYDVPRAGIYLQNFTGTNTLVYNLENVTVYNCGTSSGADPEGSGGISNRQDAGTSSTINAINVISVGNFDGDGDGDADFNVGKNGIPSWGTSEFNLSSDGTAPGVSPQTGTALTEFFDITPGTEDLHLKTGAAAIDNGKDLSADFCCDIDWGLRPAGAGWDIGADEFGATTAVELFSFTAMGYDREVLLEWQTASELDNLGFHLYRSVSGEGAYERITASVIPGLGSSPEGAKYSYRDAGLENGVTYDYKLEDIETTGTTEFHGPVSATPEAGAGDFGSSDRASGEDHDTSLITYGDPSSNSLRILHRDRGQVVLELETAGFYAEPQEDGSVRLEIPGFEALTEANAAGIPVTRTWVEAIAGRKVKLASVRASDVVAFTGLRPSDGEMPEIVATPDGTVYASRSSRSVRRRARVAFREEGLYPSDAARVVSVGFQREVKKALVELAPLRWDASRGQLLLARRLVVRISFRGREPAETDGVQGRRYTRKRSHDQRAVVARFGTTERGLHSVRYEEVLRGRRGLRARTLRLSRQGKTVAFHLEPNGNRFKPGSTLYFLSEGASVNPYGREAVYELEVGRSGEAGESMAEISAVPSGEPSRIYWHRAEWEENRYYQAALLEAPDLWLWDVLLAPVVKSYPFEVSALAVRTPAPREPSTLSVWLQGVSDFRANPDHHVRVSVNGSLVAEVSWDGKRANRVDVDLWPGLLREGNNRLELENVGDTEAAYSMVMLDRFAVEYPRVALAGDGRLRGRFRASGVAELSGLVAGTHVLDVSDAQPSWLLDTELGADATLRFRTEAGRHYLAVSPEAVYHPTVTKPRTSRLKNTRNRADYLVIGPKAFLRAANPLLELRQSEGLQVRAVAIEEVYSEFGFGEPTPEAVKDFLSYAYHHWGQPSPRYVLLLGDATFDFKDHLQTGVTNQVPPLMVKTSYLWTASDPSYAAVNGEDILPDFAIGRLPAATVEQVQAMVEKIVAYETGEAGLNRAAVVLVADNPDRAGNFEADADALAATVLASKNPEKIYLSRLGPAATRNAIVRSFDEGASLVSYLGHGGIHLWANENFFNTGDVASLGLQSQQPLLLTMNCLNGYFHFPYFNSLAEELVQARDKGAIAAFSPSGLSLNGPANLYHKALLQELFNGRHGRLGDAVLAAQEAYAETGAFPELLSIYHLLGDPALTLK